VKLQTYTPDTITMATGAGDSASAAATLWDGERFTTFMPKLSCRGSGSALKKLAEGLGMDCFSSAFDSTAVGFSGRDERAGSQSCVV